VHEGVYAGGGAGGEVDGVGVGGVAVAFWEAKGVRLGCWEGRGEVEGGYALSMNLATLPRMPAAP